MKRKGKKFVIGVVLLVIGVISLFGMFGGTEDKIALLVGAIIFIVAGGVLLYLDGKRSKEEPKVVLQPAPAPQDIYAEAEEARKNNDYFSFGLAGVSFANEDGSERQELLMKLDRNEEPFESFTSYSLKKYDYQGEPAVAVYANDLQVGVVPKKALIFVLNNWDRIKSVYKFDISSNYDGEEESPEDEERKYFAEVTLCLSK